MITASIKDAYANLLDHHSYPVGVLVISLPFETVDVNVHPRKEEVAFTEPQILYSSINAAVKDTLTANNLTFFNVSWQRGLSDSLAGKLLKQEVLLSDISNIGKTNISSDIIQIHQTYLITESKKGVLLIDQHAAHEALLYREFVNAFKKKKTESLVLDSPIIVTFPINDFEILTEYQEIFYKLGFSFEEFGKNTVRFNKVPYFFSDRNIEEVVSEIIADIKQEKIPKTIDHRSQRMLATLACKNAIKAGDSLTREQARELLDKLQPEDMLYTCPHGRPVKIDIPLSTLARWMKR
jgi:DNA mismatch repair protein MutL